MSSGGGHTLDYLEKAKSRQRPGRRRHMKRVEKCAVLGEGDKRNGVERRLLPSEKNDFLNFISINL
jgi:hypothetical protein